VTGGIHLAWEAWRPLPEDWDGSHQPALLTGNTNSTVPNSVIPAPGGGATANLGGVQAKTCSSGHVSAIGSDGVPVCTADSGGNTSLPPWLQFYGDGSEGPYIPGGTATLEGEHWFSSVNIAAGVTVRTTHTVPMIIRSTGTCTVAGTIGNSAATGGGNSGAGAFWGGSGGGGGGGTAIGAVGNPALYGSGGDKGSAGTAGGGAGGDGPAAASLPSFQKALLLSSGNVWPQNFLYGGAIGVGGAIGGGGGSAGGAGGKGGGLIVLVCPTINLTGTVDVGGQNGGDSTGNNIGAGGGGGGGILIMRSPALTNSGTINTAGGSGGSCGAFTGCGVGGKGGNGWSAVLAQ